jgi:acetyltransferase
LAVGRGGTDVEVYRDVAMTTIPISAAQAIYTLKETRISGLIEDRFHPILADIMVRVSTLTARFPQIKEMDINPLILNNEGVWAVDARMLL